jgi:hypothetical protein
VNYSPSVLEGLQLPLAGHGRDPNRVQLSLLEFEPPPVEELPQKRVLGGDEPKKLPAHGWLKWKLTTRKRKNGVDWQTDQLWFYWEEKGCKKRSRYVPRRKEDEVIEMVRGLKRPIEETLKLLEKNK